MTSSTASSSRATMSGAGTKAVLLLGIALLALVFGLIAAVFGGLPALVIAVMAAPLLMLMLDYRVGVIALTFVLPWASSPMLPRAQGLDIINYLWLFTLLALVVPRLLKRQPIVWLPRPVVWLYLLPVTMGIVVAWPYIPQGAANYAGTEHALGYTPFEFLKLRFVKPLGWVVYALLLANAVRESRQPDRWLLVLACSTLLPAAAVLVAVVLYGGDLSSLQAQRGFLSRFGMHANDFGLMLMTTAVPLIYVMAATRGAARWAWAFPAGVVSVALVLTFSRGAWFGFACALVLFVIHRRSVRAALAMLLLSLVAVLSAPDAIVERLTTGFSESRDNLLHSRSDELTAGRVASWRLLAPEVAKSPLLGRGIGSTAWSTAVRDRLYQPAHPHNLYLAIAMDLGLVGLVALGVLYVWYLRSCRRLAADVTLLPVLRAFFAGAGAAIAGLLAMGVTNGNFMPGAQQTYLWFLLAMLFAYWQRAQVHPASSRAWRPPALWGARPTVRVATPPDGAGQARR